MCIHSKKCKRKITKNTSCSTQIISQRLVNLTSQESCKQSSDCLTKSGGNPDKQNYITVKGKLEM